MRPLFALILFGLCSLNSGCALFVDAGRNVGVYTARALEKRREWHRNYKWAERAWAENCAAAGERAASPDYASGFKDGFAEYLFRGGNGEPPLAPPLCYRGYRYQTPQGYRAIDDWFAGYRHGAAVARKSGARDLITGPSSLRAPAPGAAPPPPAGPAMSPELPPGEAPKPPVLPAPRPMSEPVPPKKSAAPVPSGPVLAPLDGGPDSPQAEPDEPEESDERDGPAP